MPKTWTQKWADGKPPKIEELHKPMLGLQAGQRLLISSPDEIAGEIKTLAKGQGLALPALRERLAAKHGADATCALTTGIFLRIIAEREHERWREGAAVENLTPFWRVIDAKAPIRKKLSFDPAWIDERRAEEGL